MTELSEETISALMPQIKQVMEEFSIEKEEDVINLLKEHFREISERPSSAKLPQKIVLKKALGKTCAELGSFGGERFDVLILGYSRPRDWNADEMDEILDAWKKGPKPRENLIKTGKVMQMMKNGRMVVVSKITKWAMSKENEYIVISGDEIKEGEDPIPRDSRRYLADNKTENSRFTWPLLPRWTINAWGFAKVGDDFKKFDATITRDFADPASEKFVCKIAPAFGTYKGVFGVDEDKSSSDRIRFNFLNAVAPLDEVISPEDIIYTLLEQGKILSFKEVKDREIMTEELANEIFLVDLDDIDKFHDAVIAKRDKDGNIVKTDSKYDATNWDKFGIGIYNLYASTETKQGNLVLRFRDWTAKANSIFTNEVVGKPEIPDLPVEALVSFRTNRKPTRWDAENKVSIEDPLNGDVTLGTILGLKILNSILEE